jgi:hypothetical protein
MEICMERDHPKPGVCLKYIRIKRLVTWRNTHTSQLNLTIYHPLLI